MSLPKLAALAAVVAFFADAALAQMPGGPPPQVTAAKPIVKQITEYDDFAGRYEAMDGVEIRARVSGYLEAVAFRDGAMVKKGDLLFVVDKRPYKATLDQIEASLVSAQARLSFAESDLERAEALRKTGNIPEQLLDQRRQNYLTAKADLDRANGALREARLNYEFTEVRSPISGRIGRKLVSEGNLVNANQSLLASVVSLDPIHFYFDVDERSFLAYSRASNLANRPVGPGAGIEVLVGVTDERNPSRKARLDFIDNRVDQGTGTIRARAVVPNPDLFLTPGLFGTVRVPGSPPYDGVLVPDEAVATDQDRRIVWVVAEDGSVSSRVVRPGPRIDGYRVIRSGLKGDETVVIGGLQRIRPGIKVNPEMKDLPQVRS